MRYANKFKIGNRSFDRPRTDTSTVPTRGYNVIICALLVLRFVLIDRTARQFRQHNNGRFDWF